MEAKTNKARSAIRGSDEFESKSDDSLVQSLGDQESPLVEDATKLENYENSQSILDEASPIKDVTDFEANEMNALRSHEGLESNIVGTVAPADIYEETVNDAFGSDDSLSDLDEGQFREFDESLLDQEPEYTIASLPSFRKKQQERDDKSAAPKARRTEVGKRKRARTHERSPMDGENLSSADEEDQNKRPQDPILAAKWDLDQQMNAAITTQKRRARIDEDDLEAMADDEIMKLREQMRLAAFEDAQANSRKEPASGKLTLLPLVESVLRKKSLYDAILDNNLLESMRMWLEPLPDKSLPALDIQHVLFEALQRLPIQTEHLRESGVGKLVLFYKKSKRPEAPIKRIAERLIGDWTRPIIKRSANFRDRAVQTLDYDPMRMRPVRISGEGNDKGRQKARAQIPQSDLGAFEIAPRSQVSYAAVHGDGAPLRESDQVRKMKARMKALRAAHSGRMRKGNIIM